MDFFFTSGDKTSAAQEDFCAHSQTSTLNPKDTHSTNKGIDALIRWESRWYWVVGGGSGSLMVRQRWLLVAGVQPVIILQLFGHYTRNIIEFIPSLDKPTIPIQRLYSVESENRYN